jgi:RNA polymerase sigma-70 factor (ECF subfamily)
VDRLRALLLHATRFELSRRRDELRDVEPAEREQLATQAADAALLAVLDNLDAFRGVSRFTTWARKFALLEASVTARRRAWHGRDLGVHEPATGPPGDDDLLRAVREASRRSLTAEQRDVYAALALDGVPIDVLAERRGTTRGALYATLRDARLTLRAALEPPAHPAA